MICSTERKFSNTRRILIDRVVKFFARRPIRRGDGGSVQVSKRGSEVRRGNIQGKPALQGGGGGTRSISAFSKK